MGDRLYGWRDDGRPRWPRAIRYGSLGGLFTGIVCSAQVIGCAIYLSQIEAEVATNTAPGQFIDGNAVASRPTDIFNGTLPLVALFALLMYLFIGFLAGRAGRTVRAGIVAALITSIIGWLIYLFAACTVSAMGLHPWTPFVSDEVGHTAQLSLFALPPALLLALGLGALGGLLGKRSRRGRNRNAAVPA